MRVGILGAGALGLTAAYRIAQQGNQVTLFERDRQIGGLAAGFVVDWPAGKDASQSPSGPQVGGTYLEKFYHHIFRTDTEIVSLIRELGLGSKLVWKGPKTCNLRDGQIYRLDSAPSVLRFRPIPLLDRVRMGMAVAYLKVLRNYRTLEGTTAAAWARRWMGKAAYDAVWGPLLKAKFGDFAERIAMPWLWSRIKLRTSSLGYIRGGFQLLYDRLGERIRDLGGTINLETEVTSIEALPSGKVQVTTRSVAAGAASVETVHEFDAVLSTLPTRLFIKLALGLPESYRARYDYGDYYGAHCAIIALPESERLFEDNTYWLSVTDPGYPFLAVVEHTNFMPPEDYGSRRLVYLGNYLPMSDRRFGMAQDELLAEFYQSLKRIAPDFRPEAVEKSWVFKAPFAQPIVTLDFKEHIAPLTTPIPNVYLANMFQVYPQDRGQNYSIKLAGEVANLVNRGGWTAPE